MTAKMSATEIWDRDFLDIRHHIIDVAATLDRVDLGHNNTALTSDPRMAQLLEAVSILGDGRGDRAERVQLAFSDSFDPNWRAS